MLEILKQFFLLVVAVPLATITEAIFSLIPDLDFLAGKHTVFNSAFEWLFNTMYALDPIFPYSVQISIISIIASFYGLLFSFRLVSWIIRKIPFINIS